MMVEQGKMDDDTAAFLLNDSKGAGSAGAAPSSSSVPGPEVLEGHEDDSEGEELHADVEEIMTISPPSKKGRMEVGLSTRMH